jgi:hypothetical protein
MNPFDIHIQHAQKVGDFVQNPSTILSTDI